MRRHVDVVGHGFRFYGWLVLAIMAGLSVLMGALGVALSETIPMLIAPIYLVFAFMFGMPFVWTGRGILDGRPWARRVGIALSILLLGDFPIGTSLGLLGLGVLLDEEVARDFQNETPAQKTVGVERARARLARRARRQASMDATMA